MEERLRDGASERDLGPCRCQRSRPSSAEGTRLSIAPQGAFARSASTQSTRHAEGAQATQASARGAALQFWLDGSAGHRIVDLLQGGKVVPVLCTVCGPYGGRVVRRSLLSNCPGAGPARRVVGFPAWLLAHCTSRQYSWGSFARLVWSISHPGPISCFSAQIHCCCSSAACCCDRACAEAAKLDLSVSVAVLQPER